MYNVALTLLLGLTVTIRAILIGSMGGVGICFRVVTREYLSKRTVIFYP